MNHSHYFAWIESTMVLLLPTQTSASGSQKVLNSVLPERTVTGEKRPWLHFYPLANPEESMPSRYSILPQNNSVF